MAHSFARNGVHDAAHESQGRAKEGTLVIPNLLVSLDDLDRCCFFVQYQQTEIDDETPNIPVLDRLLSLMSRKF